MRAFCASIVIFAVSLGVAAQNRLVFEAASVKVNRTLPFGGGIDYSGARLMAEGVTLQELVRAAYGEPPKWLPSSSIIGAPDWATKDKFDVVATAGSAAPPGASAEKRLMLRALLVDRFKLTIRHETRESAVYTLVRLRADGRLGPNLHSGQPCDDPASCGMRLGIGPVASMFGRGQAFEGIVNFFSRLVDAPVIDRTGLTGLFDVDMHFNSEQLAALRLPAGIGRAEDTQADQPSFFTAVQEQLGLKLDSTRGPVDVLVIDHVERPAEN